MKEYFTRLTPNFNNWRKPSGTDGKCKASDSKKRLYEETHCFGWEEWLFEEYHKNVSNPDHVCAGFVQAFNQKNRHKNSISRLYLYTTLGKNKKGHLPGCYFVGYIDYVKRLDYLPKNNREVQDDLDAVGINHQGFLPMLPFAKNISFKVKDVHVKFPFVYERSFRLNRGQYRFSLYNLINHSNFLNHFFL